MKYIYFLIFLCFSLITFSQTALGDIKFRPEYYQSNLSSKTFDKIKAGKAFFIRPKQFKTDYEIDQYEKILNSVWTATPIEVIDEKDVVENIKIGNIFIRFKAYTVTSRATYSFNYFKFGLINKIKEKKDGTKTWWEDFFGVISFTSNVEARLDQIKGKDTIGGDLIDYRLGYLKNYMQQMNQGIVKNNSFDFYDDLEITNELINLRNTDLYVPSNILYRYNALFVKENEQNSDDLFEDYAYKYTIADENFLNAKILEAKEPFYYLMYHQKNARKIITIVNALTGNVVYRTSKNLSYNMKPKDIKDLSKAISKI
jgi:hypothetical protein